MQPQDSSPCSKQLDTYPETDRPIQSPTPLPLLQFYDRSARERKSCVGEERCVQAVMGKKSLERHRLRWQDDIKTYSKEMG
jgi:hypothetical protein